MLTQPEEDLEVEKARVVELFERLKQRGVDLDIEIFQEAPSAGVDDGDPVAAALARSIETVTGERAVFEMWEKPSTKAHRRPGRRGRGGRTPLRGT
jgi:hypothetical protein